MQSSSTVRCSWRIIVRNRCRMARSAMSGLVLRSPPHRALVSVAWETRSPRCSTRYCTSAVALRDWASAASTGCPSRGSQSTQHPDLHFCIYPVHTFPRGRRGPPTAHPFFVWFSVWVKYTKGWAACPAKKAFFRSFIWEPFAFLYKAQGYCTAYWSADCRPAASSLVSQEGTGAPMAVAFSAMEPSSVKIYHTSVTGSTSTV